jgi:hypothetical protein
MKKGIFGRDWQAQLRQGRPPLPLWVNARRYWALKALELRAGEELEAIVVDRAGLGYSVVIPLVGCRAYVPVLREMWANPGDSLTVRIELVSAQRDVLKLSVDERLQSPSTDVPSYEPK